VSWPASSADSHWRASVAAYIQNVQLPGALPAHRRRDSSCCGSTFIASVLPAARAARVDVVQALRGD